MGNSVPRGKREFTSPKEGAWPAFPQPAPPSSASSAKDALLPPPAAGEGAISAADMAPGGGGGGCGGGGSGGGVLHFVGSRRGELGTNSNQREAMLGVHLKSLCQASPREKEPGAPQGGD